MCAGCGMRYETVAGIPDLRVPGDTWVDHETDRMAARRLLLETAGMSGSELLRHVFASRGESEAWVESRTRQTLDMPRRLRADLQGWLLPCVRSGNTFLDLGCGPGALLAAAARQGTIGMGIDVSMVWLVVAQRLISESGGQPILAAALAEAIPLADDAVSSVVSLDVIEHVADPTLYLKEIDRVTHSGGFLALSTPNRFSLSAEPHVGVWGIGLLPRAWQKQYAEWRSGKSYEFTRLLSTWEARHLLEQHTRFEVNVLIPLVADEAIDHFPTHRAKLARVYNRLATSRMLRPIFLVLGPFFRIVGRRR